MASGVNTADFYANFGGLTSLSKQVKQKDPQAIREAARQFESLFTSMMLKSMREAKLGDELGESDETDMYQDMYDQQLAVQMSQGKGLGLADMLVKQLARRGEIGAADGTNSAAIGGAQSRAAVGAAAARETFAARGTMRLSGPDSATRSYPAHGGHGGRPAVQRAAGEPIRGNGRGARSGVGSASTLRERIGFVQKLTPYAERAASALGVSPDTLIAQAALETGWGRHVASGTGSGSSNNLFGVKSGGQWQGGTATATTSEYRGNAVSQVAQSFRRYDSVQQGVNDYVSLLQKHGAYHAALGSGSDPSAFAGALARGGYATDPDYVHKLVATTASVRSLRTLVASMSPAATAPAAAGGAAQASLGDAGESIRAALFKLLAGVPIADGENSA